MTTLPPPLRRTAVTFFGESLANFVSLSFDDHVKLMFRDGSGTWHRRDYTSRRFDIVRRELTLEFGLHESGPASDWAREARLGMPAVIGGPRGSLSVPDDHDWHLLGGDACALPAIHRRLEGLPAGSKALVIAQVPTPDDRRLPDSVAELQVRWVSTANELAGALVETPLPQGDGYVWCAGERSAMARAREILVSKGHPPGAMRVSAYWKQGVTADHEKLEA